MSRRPPEAPTGSDADLELIGRPGGAGPETPTPILREYHAVKARYPDAIVMARLGDFFEMFGPDAEAAAPILGVTLTGRGFGKAGRLPMCGVPQQALPQYLRRLLDAGRTVALWDQVGEVVPGRLVRREVTRVVGPGTIADSEFVDAQRVARCAAVHTAADGTLGLAALDTTTGEMLLTELSSWSAVGEECVRLDVAELLIAEQQTVPDEVGASVARTRLHASLFDAGRADGRLLMATGTSTLTGLGVDSMRAARPAAGALLAHCERCRISLQPGFLRVRAQRTADRMSLDPHTRRNLELVRPLGGAGGGLVDLLDRTRTPMGARMLREWIQAPLVSTAAIAERLDDVEALVAQRVLRARLRERLGSIRDLERLVGRAVQGIAGPRDLVAIASACTSVDAIADCLRDARLPATLEGAVATCVAPAGLAGEIVALIVDDPPASARDGGVIRLGADADLDAMVHAAADARAYIAGLEETERARTGIRSLKVGHNRVFGYYIEISNAQRHGIPASYSRRQTLAGAERYVTPELKEHEAVVMNARDRSLAREGELVARMVRRVADSAAPLVAAAAAIAYLDVVQSLAELADSEGWCRPHVGDGLELCIDDGRHPLVERALGPGRFVANDCRLQATGDPRLLILTGPNMAGKSTYLRQVAIIVLLAQIGSYVPARSVRLGICDRIFTRVGAHDDLAGGLSTFMVEMAETAAILNQATSRSLVVLDEIGRGTSTYDGLSIAHAVVEHLHDSPDLGCRTLFATHYHELTTLAEQRAGITTARVEVVEEGDSVTFLHRIVPGGADRSYGIHVARLAGIPDPVIRRARAVLADLESQRPLGSVPIGDQLSLAISVPETHPVLERIAALDVNAMTPLAALTALTEWQDDLRRWR